VPGGAIKLKLTIVCSLHCPGRKSGQYKLYPSDDHPPEYMSHPRVQAFKRDVLTFAGAGLG
jgi:hypothetical protein